MLTEKLRRLTPYLMAGALALGKPGCESTNDSVKENSDLEQVTWVLHKTREKGEHQINPETKQTRNCIFPEFTSKSAYSIGKYLGVSPSDIEFEKTSKGVSIKILTFPGDQSIFNKIVSQFEKDFGKGYGKIITWGSGGHPMYDGCYINVQYFRDFVHVKVF